MKEPETSAVPGHAPVTIPGEVQQRIGVTVGEVRQEPLKMSVRTVGIVQPDETKVARVHLRTERCEPAAERGSRAELPVGAADDPFGRLHVVRAEHYNHVGDLPALPHSPDDRLDQHGLLRRAVASGRSGGQHDGCDHSSFMCKTTMRRVGRSVARLPSRPIFSTTGSPAVTLPSTA